MPLITATELTKRYSGNVTALSGFSVTIEPGIIGLVGSNGAGKSTLIKILLGLLAPTSGSVSVLGMDPTTMGPNLRQHLGYLPEFDCLPADSSATDLVTHLARVSGLPATAARERAAEMLRHAGLYDERYRQIGTYSTGMKQRVKLAQALVHDPRLLLLDEPTNGLDPEGRGEMLDLIHRTGTEFGISVIVSSHLLGEIEQVCDYLVAIEGGRLLRAAPLRSFTQVTELLAVEVLGDADLVRQRLGEAGLTTRGSDSTTLLVEVVGDAPYDMVRDTIADLGVGLVRIERRRDKLEDLFSAPLADDTTPAAKAIHGGSHAHR
jgi:ABC-2 type transport system ATP-binding protein